MAPAQDEQQLKQRIRESFREILKFPREVYKDHDAAINIDGIYHFVDMTRPRMDADGNGPYQYIYLQDRLIWYSSGKGCEYCNSRQRECNVRAEKKHVNVSMRVEDETVFLREGQWQRVANIVDFAANRIKKAGEKKNGDMMTQTIFQTFVPSRKRDGGDRRLLFIANS